MNLSFKNIFYIAIAIGVTYFALTWYYGRQLDDASDRLRLERERTAEIEEVYNERIGTYTTRIGELSDNLSKEKGIAKEQRETIKALEKDLAAKIDQMHSLTVALDTLSGQGQSEIVLVPDTEEKIYKVNEHIQGVRFVLDLNHPSGEYNYTVAHDPITMEIYLAKEKNSEIKVGSVRFPHNPYIHVTSWQMFYDPDVRPWYEKIWDDIHLDVQAFGGANAGLGVGVGYKRVMVGPVFTEEGMNLGATVRIK